MLGGDRDLTLVRKFAQNIQSLGFHSKHSIKLDIVSYSAALRRHRWKHQKFKVFLHYIES